jgi:ribosomal protein S4E
MPPGIAMRIAAAVVIVRQLEQRRILVRIFGPDEHVRERLCLPPGVFDVVEMVGVDAHHRVIESAVHASQS